MKKTPFDNLPPLTKHEAFDILSRPIDKLDLSSDYYKAVFHLLKYPGSDTEKVLLNLIQAQSNEHSVLLAKRKAVEVLARHNSFNSIPSIGNCLKSSDPYLVENAVWALQELDCKDARLINLMIDLLDDPNQNLRVLIQALGNLGAVHSLPKIKFFLRKSFNASPGVKGASIVAIKKMSGKTYKIDELLNHLTLQNQNDRHCAVNDIIDLCDIKLLPLILKTPVAPSFRMRALNILWPFDQDNVNGLYLFSCIDSLIKSDPNCLDCPNYEKKDHDLKTLVEGLFSPDFRVGYISLKALLHQEASDLWPVISSQVERFQRDYGGLYFLMILFRSISGWNQDAMQEIKLITLSCLGSQWPNFIKFRPVAILTLVELFPAIANRYVPEWLDEIITPFWACRYACLLALQSLPRKEIVSYKDNIIAAKQDTHRFVNGKASELEELITDFTL